MTNPTLTTSQTRPKRVRHTHHDAPAGSIYVGHGSRWDNPYQPTAQGRGWIVMDDNGVDYPAIGDTRLAAAVCAVELFDNDVREWGTTNITIADVRTHLADHDLACECPLDLPCHADVLLAIANPGTHQ